MILAVVPCLAQAQDQITKASADPYAQQLAVRTSAGTTIVADKQTQTIYITTSSGKSFEVSFNSAVESLESDPAKRALLLNQFESSLSDPAHVMTLMAPELRPIQPIGRLMPVAAVVRVQRHS